MDNHIPAWMECRAIRWTAIGVMLICLAILYATDSGIASW